MIPFIGAPNSRAGIGRFGSAAGAEPGAAVAFRPDRFPPPAVVEIPRDGLAQAGLETLARLPAELAAELCRIHRIAPVVAGPVGDKADEARVRPMGRGWRELVEEAADLGHDLEVGALAVTADVVALARPPANEDGMQRAGVILDIEPVADIVALAVDRDRLTRQRLQDRERDQLFREMIGAVIVRAVAHHGRQS